MKSPSDSSSGHAMQPATWELANTILFAVIGKFCSEVQFLGMSVISKGKDPSPPPFIWKQVFMMYFKVAFSSKIFFLKVCFQNPEDIMASNFVSSRSTWLFPHAWKSQSAALLYTFAFGLQSHDVNMSVIACAQSLGVFMQRAQSHNKYCKHCCLHHWQFHSAGL